MKRISKCALCGAVRKVRRHHVIPRLIFRNNPLPAEALLDNCVPLCGPCHQKVHSQYTHAQLAELGKSLFPYAPKLRKERKKKPSSMLAPIGKAFEAAGLHCAGCEKALGETAHL